MTGELRNSVMATGEWAKREQASDKGKKGAAVRGGMGQTVYIESYRPFKNFGSFNRETLKGFNQRNETLLSLWRV